MKVVRVLLLVAIAVTLCVIVVGIASSTTGVWEKTVIVLLGLALLVAASRVRALGGPKPR